MEILKNFLVKNYGGVESITLPDGPVIAIAGENGHGKSTIVDAVRFLLTGKNAYGIRNGAAEAVVEGEMFGSYISRTLKPSGTELRLNRKKVTLKAFNEWLSKNSLDPNALKIATSSEVLSAMNAGELSDFFIKGGWIPVVINKEDMLDALALPAEETAMIDSLLSMTDITLTDVANAYKEAYEQRTNTKRYLVKLIEVGQPTGDTLEQLQKKKEEILKKEGASKVAASAWTAYENALKAVNAATTQATDLKVAIMAIPETKDLSAEIKEKKEKLRKCQETLSVLQGNLSTFKTQFAANKELLEKLKTDACPLGGGLVCKTDKTPIVEKYQGLQKEIKEQAEVVKGRIKKGQGIVTDLENAIAELEKRQKAFERRKTMEENLSKIVIPPTPEKPAVPKIAEDFSIQKKQISMQIAAWDAYNEYVKRSKEQESLAKKVEILNHVIEALAPKGMISASILNLACKDLEDLCNAQAAKIKSDFKLHFEAEDGLQITAVTKAGGPQLPLTKLSTGERSIALLLVMDLLNQLSANFRLLLIDDFEKFDISNMKGLIKMIRDSGSEALIGVVKHDAIVTELEKVVDHMIKI